MALKILLADDSMTAQNLGKKILTDAGYDVVTVSNGAAAVRKIAEVKPQVCILDIYMPGYTGLEVCARIKNAAQTSRVPVLLTVGKMEPYKPEEGARVRADGVIVKPFEATELLRAVQRFANRAPESGKAKPPAPPLGSSISVEKTVRLTREQIQEMMNPDSQGWRESAAKPLQVPSDMASAPMFSVDDVLSSIQPSGGMSESPSSPTSTEPFVATAAAAPAMDRGDAAASVAAVEEMSPAAAILDEHKLTSGVPLPGFVDYVIACESSGTAVATAAPDAALPVTEAAVPELPAQPAGSLEIPEPELAKSTAAIAGIPEASTPSVEDTQRLDPEMLAAARRASLAAEISLRMETAPPTPADTKESPVVVPDTEQTKPPVEEVVAAPPSVAAVSPSQGAPTPQEAARVEPQPEASSPVAPSLEASPAVIPAVDVNLETVPPVAIHPVSDPNLQVAASEQSDVVPEPGLEPTSYAAAAESVPITTDPDLAAYQPEVAGPKNGTAPHGPSPEPEFAVTAAPKAEEPETGVLASKKAESKARKPEEVHEEIAAALDILAGPSQSQPQAHGTRQRCWVADEVSVKETEMTVSLLQEMQRSKSLREQKPAAGAPIPEATVRDDRNSPPSSAVPGAGGTARSTHEVAPASELAAAMAAAFGGALPSSDLARAEATQPISEEVRRFALGDAYKPKPRQGFSGAAIQDAEESPAPAAAINEVRLAKAVSRAIDRLKPQIVAEIVKELKSLEE